MNTTELELLRRALPDGYELIESSPDGPSIWGADLEWQFPLDTYDSARQVITKILVTEKKWAHEGGSLSAKMQLLDHLGIRSEIQRAIETALAR